MYNQRMEVMARLDVMEDSLRNEKREHKEDVDRLNKKIDRLNQENQLLKDDNARLMYCSIMTIIETLKKRNMGMIGNIKKLFMGTPAIF